MAETRPPVYTGTTKFIPPPMPELIFGRLPMTVMRVEYRLNVSLEEVTVVNDPASPTGEDAKYRQLLELTVIDTTIKAVIKRTRQLLKTFNIDSDRKF